MFVASCVSGGGCVAGRNCKRATERCDGERFVFKRCMFYVCVCVIAFGLAKRLIFEAKHDTKTTTSYLF